MENLTITEIQARCDALAKAMGEKGKRKPDVQFWLVSGEDANLWLRWAGDKSTYADEYHVCRDDDPWQYAADWIASIPYPATEGERKFTRALADAIDIATEYSLPDEVVAPVREAQKVVNAVLLDGPK